MRSAFGGRRALLDRDAPIFAQVPISIESRERHAQTFEEIKAGF